MSLSVDKCFQIKVHSGPLEPLHTHISNKDKTMSRHISHLKRQKGISFKQDTGCTNPLILIFKTLLVNTTGFAHRCLVSPKQNAQWNSLPFPLNIPAPKFQLSVYKSFIFYYRDWLNSHSVLLFFLFLKATPVLHSPGFKNKGAQLAVASFVPIFCMGKKKPV